MSVSTILLLIAIVVTLRLDRLRREAEEERFDAVLQELAAAKLRAARLEAELAACRDGHWGLLGRGE